MAEKKPKVVKISRARWSDARRLKQTQEEFDTVCGNKLYLRENKTMCCLGFVSRALGAKVCEIQGVGMPSSVYGTACPDWLSRIEDDAAQINDAEDLTRREREKKLKALFKSTPIRLEFVP